LDLIFLPATPPTASPLALQCKKKRSFLSRTTNGRRVPITLDTTTLFLAAMKGHHKKGQMLLLLLHPLPA
jgi:hypothetical protein